jgi:hypothetical protein
VVIWPRAGHKAGLMTGSFERIEAIAGGTEARFINRLFGLYA